MKIEKKFYLLLELVFIGLISLIPLLWFRPEHMIFGSDSGYPLDYSQYFNQRLYTWTSSQSFGEDMSTYMGALPLHGIQHVLSIVGIDYFDIQKYTLVFWFASVSLAMYFCVRYFFPRLDQWIVRISAVALYSINFYIFLFWTIGSQTTLSAYAFLPITFVVMFMFIDKKMTPLWAAIVLNIFFLLYNGGGVAGLPLLGPIIVVGLGLLLYQAIISPTTDDLIRSLKLVLFSAVLFVPLNAYYLLPFVLAFTQQFSNLVAKNGGVEGVIEWTTFISKFDSYANLFRLQGDNIWHMENSYYPNTYLKNPFLIISSFIFSILAYSVLLFKIDKIYRKLIYFLILLSLVGIFLSAGAHEPLGFLYIAMIKFIPGFAAFRSAFYKFMPLVIFSIAFLDGISLYYLTRELKKIWRYVLPTIFILFLFIYHLPFYDVNNFLTNYKFKTMISIPDYVLKFNKDKPPKDSDARTLVVPAFNQNFSVEIYDWNYYSGYPIFPGVSGKSYVENSAYLRSEEKQLVNRLYELLRKEDLIQFVIEAKRLGINYILLTSDVYLKNSDSPRESPKVYEEILEKNFEPVWRAGKWTLYSLGDKNLNMPIFAFNELNLLKGDISSLPNFENDFYFYKFNDNPPDGIEFINNISVFGCVTCGVLPDIHLESNTPRVLPGSIVHYLKTFLENKKDMQATDLYSELGLSLKRISELKGLSSMYRVENPEEWHKSIVSLISNWKNADKLLKEKAENIDINAMNTFQKYSEYEISVLKEVYNYEATSNSTTLRKAIENAISQITKYQTENDLNVFNIKTNNEFLYRVNDDFEISRDIVLDSESLPIIEGQTLYPSRVKYDDGESLVVEPPSASDDLILPKPTKDISEITLYFPKWPHDDNNIEVKKISTSFSRQESCLVSGVKNFDWNRTYNISTKISSDLDNLKIYIERVKKYESSSSEFKPSGVIEVDKRNKRYIYFSIQGKEDDKNINIYFCTDPGRNPLTTYEIVSVDVDFSPILYSRENDTRTSDRGGYFDINYKRVNPTEYVMHVNNVKSPYFLAFSDRFSTSWKLTDADNNSYDNSHFVLNGYANGWKISKKGNYELTLKFEQQRIFETGIMISLSSFALLMLFLAYRIVKKLKSEK